MGHQKARTEASLHWKANVNTPQSSDRVVAVPKNQVTIAPYTPRLYRRVVVRYEPYFELLPREDSGTWRPQQGEPCTGRDDA